MLASSSPFFFQLRGQACSWAASSTSSERHQHRDRPSDVLNVEGASSLPRNRSFHIPSVPARRFVSFRRRDCSPTNGSCCGATRTQQRSEPATGVPPDDGVRSSWRISWETPLKPCRAKCLCGGKREAFSCGGMDLAVGPMTSGWPTQAMTVCVSGKIATRTVSALCWRNISKDSATRRRRKAGPRQIPEGRHGPAPSRSPLRARIGLTASSAGGLAWEMSYGRTKCLCVGKGGASPHSALELG